jgi:uncharacterized protein
LERTIKWRFGFRAYSDFGQYTDVSRVARERRRDVGNVQFMQSNREIVANAFAAWMNGSGYVASIFAEHMTWEIVGRSAVSAKYPNTQAFVDEVLHPFGARFSHDRPFRPTKIHGIYSDESQSTVVVIWDGQGVTTAGTVYENSYAWIMRLSGGKVVNGTAFYDSIAFNELWTNVTS